MEETKQNLNILDVLTLYIDFFKCQGNYFLFHSFLCFFIAGSLEKAMAPHCSTLAWKVPWMEEPGGLQSMGSRRVRHRLVTEQLQWGNRSQEGQGIFPGNTLDLTVSCGRTVWTQWSEPVFSATALRKQRLFHVPVKVMFQQSF